MLKAREFEFDYWDGDRRFGYGGYKFMPGRWRPLVDALVHTYGIRAGSKVLDIGCGKGFLLYELMQAVPGGRHRYRYFEHAVAEAKGGATIYKTAPGTGSVAVPGRRI